MLLVLLTLLLLWLDVTVRQRFDGHQWQLPARVFARPVELYSGRELAREHLQQLLDLMRYRRDPKVLAPGSYVFNGDQLVLHTRGFQDSDGGEKPQLLRLTLAQNRLQALADGTGKRVPVARLEPLQIGSIHPGHNEDRVFVALEDTPPLLIELLLATEDRQFYQHHGISLRGISRAMLANVRAGGLEQGGSTLTQQLVKNFWLTRDRTLWRKLAELPMAISLELHYSKAQILEAYLNEVYLGQDGNRAIHGMGLAAQFYFGRPLQELAPHQMATLVGLLKGPGYYNPRRFPERSVERRNTVLQVAHEQGLLDDSTFRAASRFELDVVPRGASALYAFPHFIDLVRRQLSRDYDTTELASEGMQILSTLDVLAQLAAEQALSEFLKDSPEVNGAVVVTAPDQGDVLALVGDKATRSAGFNRALDAVRPIGSLAKPAVFLTALEQPQHYHPGSIINDEPVIVKLQGGQVWEPKNFDGQSQGPMPLWEALSLSRNQATAQLGLAVGLGPVIKTFKRLGVQRDIPPYPSIFLGSLNLTPFETAVMYQTIATGGSVTPLRSITDVLDRDGVPRARYPVRPQVEFDEATMYLLQWTMMQTMQQGTGRYAATQLPENLVVAGKTGTSDGQRDAWFAGFSGSHLGLVWLGRDDNKPTGYTGSSGPLRIWTRVMNNIPQRPLLMNPPAGVELVWVAPDGLHLSHERCDGAFQVPMLSAHLLPEQRGCDGRDESKSGGGVRGWLRGLFD